MLKIIKQHNMEAAPVAIRQKYPRANKGPLHPITSINNRIIWPKIRKFDIELLKFSLDEELVVQYRSVDILANKEAIS